MDPRYQLFSLADKAWYEPLARVDDRVSRFPLASGEVPAGWRRYEDGLWVGLTPSDADELPVQGRKIHVSATPAAAERTIVIAWDMCRELGLRWKFLRSRVLVTATGSKYASRAVSGKVITIYPRDDVELEKAVHRLDEALAGREGPYILSDLRWGSGPVHLRYGAFQSMWCDAPEGGWAPAVRDASGKLVPDVHRPAFVLPSWAHRPDFLTGHLPATKSAEPMVGRFRVRKALHFSNGGGVYLAEDPDGTPVVLKEARPHAGLDGRETDATARLRHEYRTLLRLQHQLFLPRVLDYLSLWEHEYLVLEYVEGRTNAQWLARQHPLLRFRPSAKHRLRFASEVLTVRNEDERCLSAVHAEGGTFGGLHHHNIMVRPDGGVVLLNFELSSDVDGDFLAAPGFVDRSAARGVEADFLVLTEFQLPAGAPFDGLEQLRGVAGQCVRAEPVARGATPRSQCPAHESDGGEITVGRQCLGGPHVVLESKNVEFPVVEDNSVVAVIGDDGTAIRAQVVPQGGHAILNLFHSCRGRMIVPDRRDQSGHEYCGVGCEKQSGQYRLMFPLSIVPAARWPACAKDTVRMRELSARTARDSPG
jgi:hypothetical protein